MFWADEVAKEVKKRKLPLEWVDDMKTPSGRVHVGSLRTIVIHHLVYKALLDAGVKAKFTYVFEDHDPMDTVPSYLSKEVFQKYLGMPLYKVPSPVDGFKNYAVYWAEEFREAFNTIGCHPKVLWATDFYLSGKMNDAIKTCLDKADVIRGIYEELYKKKISKQWYPFNVFCPRCGKVSTTSVYDWDGKEVSFRCEIDKVDWTKGCGAEGKISPFSPTQKREIAGKIPWKVEWACKWKVIGVTVEGAGKDHMTKGGSHDLASLVAKRVINYPVPYAFSHEFLLLGGKKMSSSKGLGFSAREMIEILPPEVLRFLMVRIRPMKAINLDPYEPTTIPKLFDEYDKFANEYFNKGDDDMARIYELSQVKQVRPVKQSKLVQFSEVVSLLQMPGKEKELERPDVAPRVQYAKIWLDRFAPEEQKFTVKEEFPEVALHLSGQQKEFLLKLIELLSGVSSADELQTKLYELSKELGLSSKDAFSAIYLSLLGKDHGPKAALLILSLDKKFVIDRFREASSSGESGSMNLLK